MNSKKTITSLLLAVACCLPLSACNDNATVEKPSVKSVESAASSPQQTNNTAPSTDSDTSNNAPPSNSDTGTTTQNAKVEKSDIKPGNDSPVQAPASEEKQESNQETPFEAKREKPASTFSSDAIRSDSIEKQAEEHDAEMEMLAPSAGSQLESRTIDGAQSKESLLEEKADDDMERMD